MTPTVSARWTHFSGGPTTSSPGRRGPRAVRVGSKVPNASLASKADPRATNPKTMSSEKEKKETREKKTENIEDHETIKREVAKSGLQMWDRLQNEWFPVGLRVIHFHFSFGGFPARMESTDLETGFPFSSRVTRQPLFRVMCQDA